MNMKKCLGAWIIGFLAMFILAGLWHMLIMESFYTSNSYIPNRENPMMGYIALGYLILALLMAYIYPKGYSGGPPVREGLIFGVLVGLLWILPHTIVLYGVKNTGTKVVILVDAVWHLVEEGVGGIIMGAIYGRSFTLDQSKLGEGRLG